MADDVDISTDAILEAPSVRTAAIRASLLGDGQDECEDCLATIPAARRAAIPNAIRCAPCQGVFEAKGRAYG